MLRLVKKNSDNKLEFGDRMSVIDFLTVAPHTNAGKNLNTFIKSLKELSNQDSEAGRIAETLMLHVFSKDATLMADGTSVYSIYRAARKKRLFILP
jgi:Cys-tRNA synthase (O-phospho-L-seryl-tRNA:Cys-tRNA synthase)